MIHSQVNGTLFLVYLKPFAILILAAPFFQDMTLLSYQSVDSLEEIIEILKVVQCGAILAETCHPDEHMFRASWWS